jgi:CHAT domain-containing protein
MRHYIPIPRSRDSEQLVASSHRSMRSILCVVAALVVLTGCAGFGRASPQVRQAAKLEGRGQYSQAVLVRQGIVDAEQKWVGTSSTALAAALYNLANDQLYLAQTGQMFEHKNTRALFDAAALNASRALTIDERAYGNDDPRLGGPLRQLGIAARFQNRPEDSERFYRRALALYQRRYGANDARVGDILWEIAELDESSMRFTEEEPVLKEELTLREAITSPDSLRLAQSLEHIANFEVNRVGRYDLAEQYSRRALAIREKALPAEDPEIGESLLGLAVIYQAQNRPADAEPLLMRAILIKQSKFGADSKEVAIGLNLLAGVYEALGRRKEERATLQRMLEIFRNVFGDNDADVAGTIADIGDLDRREGRLDEAATELGQALVIVSKEGQRGNVTAASVQVDLAKLYLAEQRYSDAERAAQRAREIYEPIADPAFPATIVTHDILAKALRGENRVNEALAESETALIGLRERTASQRISRSIGAASERRGERDLFLDYVEIAADVANTMPARRLELEAETYRVAQLAQASSTADAVAGMAARFAASDGALAAIIRERQDAEARWRQVDGLLVQAAGQPSEQRDESHEDAMRAEIQSLDQELDAIDRRMVTDFPKYAEIAKPEPVSIEGTQKLLRTGEAMLVYMVGDRETYVWALTASRMQMYRAKIGRQELEQAVVALRRALDPSQLDIATLADIPPFDVIAAWQLYQAILAPAETVIEGSQVVFIVADASLQSLPFGVLVTEEPQGPITDFAQYRSIAWFARRYATTILPSVSSLEVLRNFTTRSHAPHPFLGIGDPTLFGYEGGERGVKLSALFRGDGVDVGTLRTLPALPETADELLAIAEELGAGPQDLVLRNNARKPDVMKLDFAGYRVVAFATHGLVAGDITGLAEPALVLTPPKQVGPEDDGLLKASDVSQLTFDADWVVLSACNTAAGDGSPQAEGLSGLAKAFFYAGTRTLLVSHWPVFSDATVELTTRTFAELALVPDEPRAVALQRASAALREDRSNYYFAHPMLWAPFIVVGEGGAR